MDYYDFESIINRTKINEFDKKCILKIVGEAEYRYLLNYRFMGDNDKFMFSIRDWFITQNELLSSFDISVYPSKWTGEDGIGCETTVICPITIFKQDEDFAYKRVRRYGIKE